MVLSLEYYGSFKLLNLGLFGSAHVTAEPWFKFRNRNSMWFLLVWLDAWLY